MEFKKLDVKLQSNFSNLPKMMFPEGIHAARLQNIIYKDKKTGKPRRTKSSNKECASIIWEVLDGKGKPYTEVFDMMVDDDTNPIFIRKISHIAAVTEFKSKKEVFTLTELSLFLLKNYKGKTFEVAFRQSQDGQNMEVDIFVPNDEPMYMIPGKEEKFFEKLTVEDKPDYADDDDDIDDDIEELPKLEDSDEEEQTVEFEDDDAELEEALAELDDDDSQDF